MDSDVTSYLSRWDSRPFDGGYTALRDFADRRFSGALTDGTAWLFMLNGRTVGAFDGGVEAFESTGGTAYSAPDPGLPLLFSMLERDDAETRGRYYTKDVPLSEVDETLSAGEFTGYVELTENVLSGEYYLVYYRGRTMPIAFVGSGPTLVTGDAAFERAADEVGVYEVRAVDVRVTDVPGERDDDRSADPDAAPAGAAERSTGGRIDPTRPESAAEAGTVAPGEPTAASATDAPAPTASDERAAPTRPAAGRASDVGAPADEASDDGAPADEASDDGEVRSIPALDPSDSRRAPTDDRTDATADRGATAADDRSASEPSDRADAGGATDAATDLRRRLRAVEGERDRHRAAAERLAARLRAGGEATRERTEMAPDAALAGTNLFVRYDSQAGATLADALAGEAGRGAVDANLRIERHTEFESDGVAVGGRPFDSFLTDTAEYAFVRWFVREFPYEIRETGNERSLGDLYEAVADVDRVELRGALSLAEETSRREEVTRSFDAILRDRTGDPLVVADVNDSRDPATEEMADSLVEDVRDSAGTFDSLAGAFLVTASFFDPGAVERVADATGGGLLGRGRRKSYVKLSRKRGYHLCLVEARDGEFHVSVPEL